MKNKDKRGTWEEVDHELTVDAPMVVWKKRNFIRLEEVGPSKSVMMIMQ